MKRIKFCIGVIVLSAAWVAVVSAEPSVSIDQITKDDQIVGSVQGLATNAIAESKVVVYIHTDTWHLYPYPNHRLDDGFSWSSIGDDGKWCVHTADHDLNPDKIAVLIVQRVYQQPATVTQVEDIPHAAILVKPLAGTEDREKI